MVYDVAVSGLGPAGTAFLKGIEGSGLKVIAFDRAEFPRKKLCAGGLTPKAYSLLSSLFSQVERVVRVRVHKFVLCNGGKKVILPSEEVLTYLTDRKELDNFLFESSVKSSDFTVHTKEAVLGVEREGELWRIKTEKGTYRARVVVASDGANSRIARQLKVKRDFGFTFEVDVETPYREEILIDFTDFDWGYYWIFPKGDFVTAGLGEFRKKVPDLKEKLERFNRKHGVVGKTLSSGGFPIPCGKRKNDVLRDRVLFLGDAGGLVDPLTGEGIYSAVKSGVIAADAVRKAFETGDFKVLELYKRVVDEELGSEFFWARVVGNLFFKFKSLNFYVVEKEGSVGQITAELLSGKISYRQGIKEFFKLLLKLLARG
ncbi:geranylgeranyl reductase family protein [Phorcysia thermohydrogeniphila]|uniref:Geranylgeranyl reductase family protein n=1 Tax=Phorcysia thermohydrogeniphila TaxID=936138 RepID=A0A4R1G7I0_9BACT|nr:geranylgeranyl reductase family protein [Phorcysia thermohydrogeniphila]TCK04037.1 geranylgeranyl reductase family protein [Phorcysia thermohydrogeniphila]